MLFYVLSVVFFVTLLRVNNFVFVDESGLNREYRRMYARAKRGVKVHEKRPGKRVKKTNIIAGLLYGVSGKRHVAVRDYEHSTNSEFFEDWFEWELLAAIPENSIIVMDNASFHRKNKLIEIAGRYGVCVLFLPPYSPEFNPIEKSWANFKAWLSHNGAHFPSIDLAVLFYFDQYYYYLN